MSVKVITGMNSFISITNSDTNKKTLSIPYNQSTYISIIYMRMKGTIMESIVQAKRVLEIFKEMSQIPRESGNEKGISDYIVNFAKNLGLEVHQDDQFNVVIKSQHLQVMKTDLLSSYKAISIWFVYEIMTQS